MFEKLKKVYLAHQELISYLFFGGATTVVNIVVFWLCDGYFGEAKLHYSVRIAWLVSVLFAYITNRQWVFRSKAQGSGIVAEALKFFGARVFSGILDEGFMRLTVQMLSWNSLAMKIVSNVFVIILNYIMSKLIVFRKQKQ